MLCLEGTNLTLTHLLNIQTQLDDLLLPWHMDLSLLHQIDHQALLEHIKKEGVTLYPL